MENKRQDLIDFINWLHIDCGVTMLFDKEEAVDEFLSIKSNEPNEFRAIGNNEKTQEVCECEIPEVDHNDKPMPTCNICHKPMF